MIRTNSHEVYEVASVQPCGEVVSWKADVSQVRWRALVRVMPQQGQYIRDLTAQLLKGVRSTWS